MRAIVWTGPNQLEPREVPAPRLCMATDAIVRVEYASTCGTDVHAYRGAVPGFEPGTILGHEFLGVVEAIGDDVRLFEPGARVWSAGAASCGACPWCLKRRFSQCPSRMLFGFSGVQPRLDGAFAERVRVPWVDTTLWQLPDDRDPRAGLLAADVLPTALGGLERLMLASGDRLVVVGCGPVGLTAACVARHCGIETVALDTSPVRAARAATAGVVAHCVAATATFDELIARIGGPADGTIDAVGGEHGLTCAIELVRAGGGHVVGVGSQIRSYPIDWWRALRREISISFVLSDAVRMRAQTLRVLEEGFLPLDVLFSDTVPLAELPEYYPRLLRREAFKAVVKVSGGAQRA